MGNQLRSMVLFVESSSGQFDSDSLYELVKEISEGTVWNFITAAYVFKTHKTTAEVSKLIQDEAFPPHIVFEVNPAAASGLLQSGAWESWFGDVFYEDRERIAKAKGWDEATLKLVRDKKVK